MHDNTEDAEKALMIRRIKAYGNIIYQACFLGKEKTENEVMERLKGCLGLVSFIEELQMDIKNLRAIENILKDMTLTHLEAPDENPVVGRVKYNESDTLMSLISVPVFYCAEVHNN